MEMVDWSAQCNWYIHEDLTVLLVNGTVLRVNHRRQITEALLQFPEPCPLLRPGREIGVNHVLTTQPCKAVLNTRLRSTQITQNLVRHRAEAPAPTIMSPEYDTLPA